jgi:hypothetical protein
MGESFKNHRKSFTFGAEMNEMPPEFKFSEFTAQFGRKFPLQVCGESPTFAIHKN